MPPKAAIEILEEVKELDDTMYAYNPAYMNAMDMAIEALKEIQLYKDNKLCLIPEDVYSRQCSELDAYKEIGTVEECRAAVEKQKPKKCIIDSCSDHAHYKCPSCGQIELSIYKHGFPRLGRITKYCENCGQALIDENLEGMEDEQSRNQNPGRQMVPGRMGF